jgi:hypothetical protein
VLEEVITPRSQPVRFDLELAGELIQRLPAQQRSTASIFLFADQRGLERWSSTGPVCCFCSFMTGIVVTCQSGVQRNRERWNTTIVGGFCERGPGRPYNSVAVVDGSGVLLHYRKLHLFGAEKEVFTPGNLGLPIADTSVGRIGVCVCYDLRFVEVVRTLALRGAEIVCVPSAWVGGFDAASDSRTHGCAQSDGAQLQANLNQVFVACAARSGIGQDMTFLGSSLLVDPTGQRPDGACQSHAGLERHTQH